MSRVAVYKDTMMCCDEAGRRQPLKYHSLPELQSRTNGQSTFHCNRGSTTVVVPRCPPWDDAHEVHASGPSLPRVRHASAPLPVFFQYCLRHPRRHQPHDDSWGVKTSLGQKWRPLLSHSRRAHREDIDLTIEQFKSTIHMLDVATVTPPVRFWASPITSLIATPTTNQRIFSLQASNVEPSHNSSPGELEQQNLSELHCEQNSGLGSDSGSNSSSASMTFEKHSKAFRRQLVVDFEHKIRQSFNNDDNEPHDLPVNHINHLLNEAKPSSPISPSPISSRHSQLRTIRRKRRLSIVRTNPEPEGAVAPITISLTLDSSETTQVQSQNVASASVCVPADIPENDPTPKYIIHSNPMACPSSIRPPISEEESVPPASPSNLTRPSTPNVRLGHPTRPYYSAIRKEGISPRPSSVGTFTSSIRPKSYSPPHKSVPSSPATRHWSMSAVHPGPSGVLSVFSLDENDLDDEEDGRGIVQLVPTKAAPIPSRLSFGVSLASAAKSLSRKRSASLGFAPSAFSNKSNTHKQAHSISCSPSVPPLLVAAQPTSLRKGSLNSKTNALASEFGTPGAGFSVSGETELKMALALAEVQGGIAGEDNLTPITSTTTTAVNEDVFFSTPLLPPPPPPFSPPALPSSSAQTTVDTSVRKSLASRVKKLRKGLKDLLVTTSHGNDR